MSNIAIVVIAYNRLNCLKRILTSLNNSIYSDVVDLIISIDKSENEKVYDYASEFKWNYGKKIVIKREKQLGLKKHVIECGNLTKDYENIIVLEDDVYVSPYFYNYAKQVVQFYKHKEDIAGISLYKHKRNMDAEKPFQNEINEYDTFFIQYAQSWGQIWNRKEWNNFLRWFEKQDDKFEYSAEVPGNLFLWSEKSWLKYHIRYCIENNKYFVYPNISHSTNFNNIGSHASTNSPTYQLELMYGMKNYKFMEFNSDSLKYDSFFEREGLEVYLGVNKEELCTDIYGKKNNIQNKRYWLTTKIENYKIIKSFGLELRPQEMNIINNIEGNHIFLYDTTVSEKNIINKSNHRYHLHLYYQGENTKEDLLSYTKYKYIEYLKYAKNKIIRMIFKN